MWERKLYIDIAKGIGILLVIFGHMGGEFWRLDDLLRFIYAFHMPLFVMLSGMVFKPQNIKKNIKSLLICYFTMSICITLASTTFSIITGRYNRFTLINQLFSIVMGAAAPYFKVNAAAAVWFFTALIVVEIISYFTQRIAKGNILIRILLCVLYITIGYLLSFFKENSFLPWNIDVAFLIYPFFEFGSLTKEKYNKLNHKWYLCIGLMLMIVVAFLAPLNTEAYVNIYRCNYGNSLILYYLTSIVGSLGIVALSICVDKIRFVAGGLSWMGRNTVVMMSVHQILITIISIIYNKMNIKTFVTPAYQQFAIVFIAVVLVSIIAAYIVQRWLPFLLGKEKNKEIKV